jgi:hypothetical protein
MQSTFESPLLIKSHTEFTALDFGPVEQAPEIARLRMELNNILWQTTAPLPSELSDEARSILSSYSGGDRDFYRLFYVPIWSFLHWLPSVSREAVDQEILRAARTAHAMSLFLHLWDDHLCDRQLPVDMLRLHVRTLAWERFRSQSLRLCQLTGADMLLPDEHIRDYLESVHRPEQVSDLDGYCRRSVRQLAIWTIVPRLLAGGLAGPEAASELCGIIESFEIAWRLVDDVQDIDVDLLNGDMTAVYIELDDAGRKLWGACRDRSIERGRIDPECWSELSAAIRKSGCLSRILRRIDDELQSAARSAGSRGWAGTARELEECRRGILAAFT